jgi:hypothetical protein
MNGDSGQQQHEDDPQGERDNIVIQSLLATIEKQANIISEQYATINTMGERIYEVVNQNNQIMKVVYEATIALPDHVKNTGDDFDKNAFSRFGVLRDQLSKVYQELKAIQQHINIQTSSYGYTEERPSSFAPGGDRGIG